MGSEIYSHKIISKWNPASATIVWADWSGTLCRMGCQNTATPESVVLSLTTKCTLSPLAEFSPDLLPEEQRCLMLCNSQTNKVLASNRLVGQQSCQERQIFHPVYWQHVLGKKKRVIALFIFLEPLLRMSESFSPEIIKNKPGTS